MRLPKTSRSYPAEIEELTIGRGDYTVGGARSPAFLDLDGARHRRPVIFGEAFDTLDGYHSSAASMFSGRQTDIEEWSVMWKELGADGICLRLTRDDSPDLVRRIVDRARIPVMVSADTDILKRTAETVTGSTLVLKCDGEEQSLEISKCSCGHVVVAKCDGSSPAELCERMMANGAEHIMVDLGNGRMDGSLGELRDRIAGYRMDGLMGVPGSQHTVICDVTETWDAHSEDVSARRASMFEAMAALTVMMAGADVVVVKGPGAADMARVYGEELADL
jgi:CO dehydrogenase/acetyl-CoA synthase gamma subunit (corrinoid Fe-S protein)